MNVQPAAASAPSFRVDPAVIEEFNATGATVVRGAFKEWIDLLRRGVTYNVDHPSSDGHTYTGKQGAGRFLSDYCNWERIPEYREFIFNSPAGEVASQLMNSERVRLFHEHVLVKEAATDVATPWHQDQPYYCVEGPKTVSLWIPLDEVPRDTAIEFIGGSHLWGKFYRPQRFNGEALNPNDGLEDIPDINGNRDAYDICGWHVYPGDAVAFDYRTLHGAPPNRSATRQRRAFSLRLVGDGARFVRREDIKTSPPFRHVTAASGSLLSDEDFPVVYPNSENKNR